MADQMTLLRMFFTLQKIANYGPPPALVVRPEAVEIYRLPPREVAPRLRNTVLGYGEPEAKKDEPAPVLVVTCDF